MKKSSLILYFLIFSFYFASAQKEWINLFDGKTLNGWKQAVGSAKYSVENNTIIGETVAKSPNSFLITEKEYGDFILEMDVKIDDTFSNSGIQFRSHFNAAGNEGKGQIYGYQFELDPASRKWSGGIYEEAARGWLCPVTLNPPAQNAFKVGEFNHIRLEAIGNEIKTWINNQPVSYLIDSVSHNGFIGLQVHQISNANGAGKKIYFKNIRIKTTNLSSTPFPKNIFVVNMIPNYLSPVEKQNGWQLLFDGKTSNGWRGAFKTGFPEHGWKIDSGMITVLQANGEQGKNGGDVVTTKEYSAFDLTFQFKLTPGANSGVKYFVTLKEKSDSSAIGLEYQLLDDKLHPDAKLGRNGDRTLASLYDLIPAQKNERYFNPPGKWNWGRIVVYPNNHVEHWLNGIKVLEYERGSKEFEDLVAISKYKIWQQFGEAKEGHILLQDHGNEVSFRSIKIKELR
ncbi:MAG: 3-keto-disaccharide hydrolase [Chitinophagaceae bacterium]